jgi:hypothetical protein
MKFSATLLALCVFQSTSAFVVKAPNVVNSQTQLHSTFYANTETVVKNVPVSVQGVSSGASALNTANTVNMSTVKDIWQTAAPVTVQGGSLRTWSFSDPAVERVQVLLKTEGRPLNANVELWHGPDNTPQKMAVYLEDGSLRPFNCVLETPRGQNAIAVRNTGFMEFPLSACVLEEVGDDSSGSLAEIPTNVLKTVQGGAIFTTPFGSSVNSVRILLKTDGRPLSARIELLQGPSNNKQVMEIYTEDGLDRPFYCVIETPGSGNVVRIVNAATMEFPLVASVEPFIVE